MPDSLNLLNIANSVLHFCQKRSHYQSAARTGASLLAGNLQRD
jgi:hypothetical protein